MGVLGATIPIRMKNPISVRIERSRDALRDRAVPMGVSTSLDTNGKERTRRERECRSGCKPFAKAISRSHVGKQILFLLRHRRGGHVAARAYRRGEIGRGSVRGRGGAYVWISGVAR